jgi:hypothetical protein
MLAHCVLLAAALVVATLQVRPANAQQQGQTDWDFLSQLARQASLLEQAAVVLQAEATKPQPQGAAGDAVRHYKSQSQWLGQASSRCSTLAKAIRDRLRQHAQGSKKLTAHEATHVVQQAPALQKQLIGEAAKQHLSSASVKARHGTALGIIRTIGG